MNNNKKDKYVQYNIDKIKSNIEDKIITFSFPSRKYFLRQVEHNYQNSFLSPESKHEISKLFRIRKKVKWLLSLFIFNLILSIVFTIIASQGIFSPIVPIIFGIITFLTLLPIIFDSVQKNNVNNFIDFECVFTELEKYLTSREKTIMIYRRTEVKMNYYHSFEKIKYRDFICIVGIAFERSLNQEYNHNNQWEYIFKRTLFVEKDKLISKCKNFLVRFSIFMLLTIIFAVLSTLLITLANSYDLRVFGFITYGISLYFLIWLVVITIVDKKNFKLIKEKYFSLTKEKLLDFSNDEIIGLLKIKRANFQLSYSKRKKILSLIIFATFLDSEEKYVSEPKEKMVQKIGLSDLGIDNKNSTSDWFKN